MAESDFEFVEKIFEPARDIILFERDGKVHFTILPAAQDLAEHALKSPELWISLVKKARFAEGKDRKEAHAALCYGMAKLVAKKKDFPPDLRDYIVPVLLKECGPGKKHKHRFTCRNIMVEKALTKLWGERGISPTRNDDVRDRAGRESGSAIVAAVLRSSFGWDIDERGVEEIWTNRKQP